MVVDGAVAQRDRDGLLAPFEAIVVERRRLPVDVDLFAWEDQHWRTLNDGSRSDKLSSKYAASAALRAADFDQVSGLEWHSIPKGMVHCTAERQCGRLFNEITR